MVCGNLRESSRINYGIHKIWMLKKLAIDGGVKMVVVYPATKSSFYLPAGNMGLKVSKNYAWPRRATAIIIPKTILL